MEDSMFDFGEVMSMALSMDEEDRKELVEIVEMTDEEELKEIVWALDGVADNISYIFQVIKNVRPDFQFPSIN